MLKNRVISKSCLGVLLPPRSSALEYSMNNNLSGELCMAEDYSEQNTLKQTHFSIWH